MDESSVYASAFGVPARISSDTLGVRRDSCRHWEADSDISSNFLHCIAH